MELFGTHIKCMGWWDVVGKVFISLITAGVLGGLAFAWDSARELSEIRVDLAVVKATLEAENTNTGEKIARNSLAIEKLEDRLRDLEARNGRPPV